MKNHRTTRLLFATALAVFLGLFILTAPAIAQAAAPVAQAVADIGVTDADTPPAPAVAATPWYADGAVIGGIIAAVTSLLAVWSRKQATTAHKVSESLVIAIEAASKIPAVADKEKAIKAKIREQVTQLGVQPLVHRIVKDLT